MGPCIYNSYLMASLRAAASLLAVLLSTAAADPLALTNFTSAPAVTSVVDSIAVQARSPMHFVMLTQFLSLRRL